LTLPRGPSDEWHRLVTSAEAPALGSLWYGAGRRATTGVHGCGVGATSCGAPLLPDRVIARLAALSVAV